MTAIVPKVTSDQRLTARRLSGVWRLLWRLGSGFTPSYSV